VSMIDAARATEGLGSPLSEDAQAEVLARGPWQLAWSRLKRDRVAQASTAFIIFLVLFAASAPLLADWTGHTPAYQGTNEFDPNTGLPLGMGADGLPAGIGVNGYVLGASDANGHDMLVWLAYGARTSLFIGLVSTFFVVIISLLMGLLAGFYGGWRDTAVSRVIDVVAAFPFLLFGIAMSLVFGQGKVWVVVLIIVFFSWFYPARIFRSEILALREREFVDAARMVGASNWRIMRTHLLPHLVPPAIVYGTLSIAAAISFEAAISYLGFGLTVDTPSWGYMINQAAVGGYYQLAPRLMLFPGTALFLTVLAFNLLGDGLRDALDPRGGSGA
jgi:peptide/nickel transport system permease protein